MSNEELEVNFRDWIHGAPLSSLFTVLLGVGRELKDRGFEEAADFVRVVITSVNEELTRRAARRP